jgi:hypothetical protein
MACGKVVQEQGCHPAMWLARIDRSKMQRMQTESALSRQLVVDGQSILPLMF